MVQTTETPAPARPGFLRRFLVRGERPPEQPEQDLDQAPAPAGPPALIDLRDDPPATQWRLVVSERLVRLETGMFLIAQTMKRAFAEVYDSMDDLRRVGRGPGDQVERILDESLSSLKAAVEELTESIHRVPYILAAAADDITSKLERTSRGPDALANQPSTPVEGPWIPSDVLPATPFELEPVEDQFAPLDDDAGEFDARKIWGLEA